MNNRSKSTNALYTDRIRLLQADPDRYFQLYPKPKFGFQASSSPQGSRQEAPQRAED